MEVERGKPWNFHTCKSCPYRTKSTFVMCKHVQLHRTRPKTDFFMCDSKAPETLECEFCTFESELKVDLLEHFRVFHEGKEDNKELKNILNSRKCTDCTFETQSVVVMMKHMGDCNRITKNSKEKYKQTHEKNELSAALGKTTKGDTKMSKHSYYLLRRRDNGHFQISKRRKENTEKLARITPISTNGVETLEKLKNQFESFNHWQASLALQKPSVSSQDCLNDAGSSDDVVKQIQPSASQNFTVVNNATVVANVIQVPSRPKSTGLVLNAAVRINTENSWVVMTTKMVLHKGTYRFNLIAVKDSLMGFVFTSKPELEHVCNLNQLDPDKDWTYALVVRKPSELIAKVTVEFCSPIGQFEGDELNLTPDELTTPLRCGKSSFHPILPPVRKSNGLTTPKTNRNRTLAATEKYIGKRHCCYYCKGMYVELSSHLVKMHTTEPEIMKIVQMKVNSRERIHALRELRLKGDHNYNRQVALSERIPTRKLSKNKVQSCITCQSCFRLLAPRNFARHERLCTGRPANRKRVAAEAAAIDRKRFTARVISSLLQDT